eukprot:gene4789-6716_t
MDKGKREKGPSLVIEGLKEFLKTAVFFQILFCANDEEYDYLKRLKSMASATAIRNKDWIFNALWASCEDEATSKCSINIPVTVIFQNGQPSKAISTNRRTNYLKRDILESIAMERSLHEKGLRGESFKLLRATRSLLLAFQQENQYDQIEDCSFCKVFYTDNQVEDMNLHTFDVLIRNETWRLQVLMIQAFVPTLSILPGNYSIEPQVKSLLIGQDAEAANNYTRALAKFAEKAYATNMLQNSEFDQNIRLKIVNMQSKFGLDSKNKIFFLYSEFLTIEFENGRREIEEYLAKEKSAREVSAAESVAQEMLSLLQHAIQRGLSMEDSFRHFDLKGNGYIDTDLLIDGLARLGIGLTYPVGETVIQIIGGIGSNFITISEFEQFMMKPLDLELFEKIKNKSTRPKSMNKQNSQNKRIAKTMSQTQSNAQLSAEGRSQSSQGSQSVSGSTSISKKERTLNQLLPPLKDVRILHDTKNNNVLPNEDFMNIEASQMHDWEVLDEQMISPNSNKGPRILPLPEASYHTGHDEDSNANSADLPKWASKRSQRALREIRSSQNAKVISDQTKVNQKRNRDSSGRFTANDVQTIEELSKSDDLSAGQKRKKKNKSDGTKPPIHKKKPDVTRLTLEGIVSGNSLFVDHSDRNSGTSDELLHVDHGVIMTYRVVHGSGSYEDMKTHEKTDSLRYRSILQVREKNLINQNADNGDNTSEQLIKEDEQNESKQQSTITANNPPVNSRSLPFTLVLIPDLFMTLDTMQSSFQSLLTKYPFAKIVLIGLPGLPNTTWPKGWILNSDLHSRSIAKCLQHLLSKKIILSTNATIVQENSNEPVFMFGFGTGSYSLSRFISLYLPQLPRLEHHVRSVGLVNGLLRYNKKFKKICKELRSSLSQSTLYEINELVTSLHFWNDYLFKEGKENVLQKFWSTRRGLRMSSTNSDTSDVKNDGLEQDLDDEDEDGNEFFSKIKQGQNNHDSIGLLGVLEQLKGIIISPDDFDGAEMLNTQIPVHIIQSTEDVFIDPKNAQIFSPDYLPANRTLVNSVADSVDLGAVNVSWLASGHEIIQERNAFLLSYISNLAQLCGVKPLEAFKEQTENGGVDTDDDVFDVLDLASKRKTNKIQQDKSDDENSQQSSLQNEDIGLSPGTARSTGTKSRRSSRRSSKLTGSGVSRLDLNSSSFDQEEKSEVQDVEDEQLTAAQEEQREKRRLEANKKKVEQILERRKRELLAIRNAEKDIYIQKELAEKDRKSEIQELSKMRKEDKRSKFAAEYALELQINELTFQLARTKKNDLDILRREEAIRKVEERMARQRAERVEERRKKSELLLRQIENDELTLSGMQEGGYDMPDDTTNIGLAIEASHRIMKDLLECRQRTVEALKRQAAIEDKTLLFKKQLASMENEEQRLRRAIRLIEINPSIIGKEMNVESELAELKRSLLLKQESLVELTSIAKEKSDQLQAANKSAQNLKIAMKERDAMMMERLQELQKLETILSIKLKEMKFNKETLTISRDKRKLECVLAQKRVEALLKEINRVKNHKGDLVDTDVWMEGVLQRCRTDELKKHLKTEHENAVKKYEVLVVDVKQIAIRIFDTTDHISKVKRDVDKLSHVSRLFYKTYKKFSKISVAQIMKNLNELQNKAVNIEERRAKEMDLEKLFSDSTSNLIDKIRLKDSDIRTKDERLFVGFDLVLHPEAYLHLSVVEAEQMQFDEDYQCTLAKSDLERILKLPQQINLALSFLHSEHEIIAHRILNKFMNGCDEEYFRQKDYVGQGSDVNDPKYDLIDMTGVKNDDATENDAAATKVDVNEGLIDRQDLLKDAEVIHDILVKESLRDRLRSIGREDNITEEEYQWLQLDKILSPHVYDTSELGKKPLLSKKFKKGSSNNLNQQNQAVGADIEKMLTTSVISKAKLPSDSRKGGAGAETMQEISVIKSGNDGDVYEDLRNEYNNNGNENDMFDELWHCPFNKQQLLIIRRAKVEDLVDPQEVLVRSLMDKYYVDEAESILGNARFKMLQQVSNKMSTMINDIDSKALNEKKLLFKVMDQFKNTGFGAEDESMIESSQVSTRENSAISTYYDSPDNIKRIWGSWEQVHPASAGKESQSHFFLLSTFDSARDNPASFAIHEEEEDNDDSEDEEDLLKNTSKSTKEMDQEEMRNLGMKALTTLGTTSNEDYQGNSSPKKRKGELRSHSKFFITDSMSELAQQDPRTTRGKIVLLLNKDPMTLLTVKDATLQARQSRSHYFSLPDRESLRILDLTVSIVFQGDFSQKGYKLGRLSAALFRLPPDSKTTVSKYISALPISVGYSPYKLQSPNLTNSMGRLVIIHKPKIRPMRPGTFQIVIGAASATKYSIEVTCKYAQTALPQVDESITKAREMQSKLPIILKELESLTESIKLTERKLLVCNAMIQEAEAETERCQTAMMTIKKILEKDDVELLMLEDERRGYQRELSIVEIEYSQWANTFSTRCQEKDDIKEGLEMMHEFNRVKLKEKATLKSQLETYRRDLPACIGLLRNLFEAANVASSLNTTVQGISAEANAAAIGDFGGIKISTPAEDVRRQLKQFGFDSLLLPEQQWCLLDQALNPHKYDWLREQEEKEAMEREALGKKPKQRKYNASVESFRMKKVEIEHILSTPFGMLTRREVVVRKLITKYHDDSSYMKKAIQAAAFSFDPHLAEKVRAKHHNQYNAEEQDWVAIDRVLHPEVWKYYVNNQNNSIDRNARSAALQEEETKSKSSKFSRSKSKRITVQQNKVETGGDSNLSPAPLNDNSSKILSLSSGEFMGNEPPTPNNHALGEGFLTAATTPGRPPLKKSEQRDSQLFDGITFKYSQLKREEIMRIWKSPRYLLKTDEEKAIYKLLQKYNGSYASYLDAIEQTNKRKENLTKEGKHIQWDRLGGTVSKDADYRARELLREIDRATFTQNEWIHSDVLHANDQRFPTKVLRTHLEEALDNLLKDQILDRERAGKIKVDSSDSDDDPKAVTATGGAAQHDYLSLDEESSDDEDGNVDVMAKIRKRAALREKRRRKLKKESLEDEVMKAKKVINTRNKGGVELAEAILQNQLGVDGCLACRTRKCQWSAGFDEAGTHERIKVIDRELERVRMDRDSIVFESEVCLSAMYGGNKVFRRMDLIDELTNEHRELERKIELRNVDQELHDAFNTRKEYFQSKHLHGYSIMLWTSSARQALQNRQSRLVAIIVSKEVVDDILDWMLEGWMFGERQSQFSAIGLVPTVQLHSKIRAGNDQRNTMEVVVERIKKRAEKKLQNIVTAENRKGRFIEKAWEIEMNAQTNLTKLKVARDGNSHEHLLNETESTLRFGLFMLTIMYFRAMTFLRREKQSWSGEDDEIGLKKGGVMKVMTDERMRMIDEENKALARRKKIDIVLARSKIGEARRLEREAAERREAILRLNAVVRRQRLETASICTLQKVYRGHLGRKAAKRWALKRAELGAMTALLNAAAICLQRYWRGYMARDLAVYKRMEMAQFIALMRVQEAEIDEELFWQTHPWTRFKKNQKEWMKEKMEKYLGGKKLGEKRLTVAEQAEMEAKTLASIRAEIDEDEEENEDEEEENRVSAKNISRKASSVINSISRDSDAISEMSDG